MKGEKKMKCFAEYAEGFLYRSEGESKNISKGYRAFVYGAIKNHICPIVGKKSIQEIKISDRAVIENTMLLKGRKPSTVHSVLSLFDRICRYALEEEKREKAGQARKAKINYADGKNRSSLTVVSLPEDADLSCCMLLSSFIRLYEKCEAPVLMANTRRSYKIIDDVIISSIGGMAVGDVTRRDIVSVLQKADDSGPSKAGKAISRLKVLFRVLENNRVIDDNPCKEIASPKRKYLPLVCLSQSELKCLSEYFKTTGIYSHVLLFAMHSPIPLSQVITLKWDDYKPSTGEIMVRYQALSGYNGTGADFIALPEKRVRTVILGNAAKDDIEAAQKIQKKYRENGVRSVESGLIFCRPDGSPVPYHSLSGMIPEIQRVTGIKSFSFYQLYRSFGANGLKNGVPIDVVHAQMGYLSRIATENLYVKTDAIFDDGEWEDGLLSEGETA